MDNYFTKSGHFSEDASTIKKFIEENKHTTTVEHAVLQLYSKVVKAMCNNGMTKAEVAEILGESRDDIGKFYNLSPDVDTFWD